MSKQTEALKLALKVLILTPDPSEENMQAVMAIREALAEQPAQQEKSANRCDGCEHKAFYVGDLLHGSCAGGSLQNDPVRCKKLKNQPAQRKPSTNFDRFNGVDIQYRTGGTNWPAPYRVRVTSNKNERDEFRSTLFCDSLDEAIEAANGIKGNA